MTVYTQQANNLMERLPISEQQFIVEFIKRISKNYSSEKLETVSGKPLNQKEAVRQFIEGINATPPLVDDDIDEILNNRVNITRDLGDI